MSLFTVLGLAGVACIIAAYFLLQTQRSQADSPRYLWLNLVGSVLITLSLIPEWNLPAFVIEVFWIAITLYGFWRARAARKKSGDFNGAGEGIKKNASTINFPLASGPEQD